VKTFEIPVISIGEDASTRKVIPVEPLFDVNGGLVVMVPCPAEESQTIDRKIENSSCLILKYLFAATNLLNRGQTENSSDTLKFAKLTFM
jgi:hypothetical protein